jgi:DNA-binding XRE family transcriptional regulator
MDEQTKKRLENRGWGVGSVEDFVGLSPEELAYIDMRIALCRVLRSRRKEARISQQALAHKLDSTRSQVLKIESGDPSVTMDLLVRALLAVGASPAEIGRIFVEEPEAESLRRAS